MNYWLKYLLLLLMVSFSACQKNERGLVVGKIKKASKLATTEFIIDKVVYGSKTKRLAWVIKLNEAKFLAYSQAKITAGVDLDQLKAEDIEIDAASGKISIVLPHVEVLNFSYPAESFRKDTLISDNAFLNKVNLEDQEQFFLDAEIDIRNNLDNMGIKETTEENTRKLLKGLLKTLGYREIYISFKSEGQLIKKINPEGV